MSFTPAHTWLITARYLESKRAIVTVFSGKLGKNMLRLPFFPRFYVNKRFFSLGGLKAAIGYGPRRFRVEDAGDSFRVTASTFSDLNYIADALFRETGFRAIVLEPERQFLFEKEWAFFDFFTFFSENEFEKSASFVVPEAKLDFFSEPLDETLSLLLQEDRGLGLKLVDSIVLSNLLGIGMGALPESDFSREEALFEKAFWKIGLSAARHSSCPVKKMPVGDLLRRGGLAEVDFSLLWPMLLSKNVYNLGPDSIGCSCCKPGGISDSNILPDSRVFVEFLQDGFFFESSSRLFAGEFHGANPGKESRVRRKKEFCLKNLPCGPFFRFQKQEVPLDDAVSLERNGEARVLGAGRLSWFCMKSESAVSREIGFLNVLVSALERECDSMQSVFLKKHGVLGPAFLSNDLDFLLAQARLRFTSNFLCSIPRHLCSEESAFYDGAACSAIEAVEARVLESFRVFAGSRDERVVAVSEEKAYVRSKRPYSLIKLFSEAKNVPCVLKARNRA